MSIFTNDQDSQNLPSRLSHKKGERRKKRSRCGAVFAGIAVMAVIAWILGSSFLLQSMPIDTVAKIEKESPVAAKGIQPDDHEDLDLFRTLKSCDPTVRKHRCQQNVHPDGSKKHRIGILSPPGELGSFYTQWVKDVFAMHATKNTTHISLIPTSRVPPYGYGKNHGYTKIIRLVSLPISLASADAVRSVMSPSLLSIKDTPTRLLLLSDLRAATRQLVRWHNRLSHVAAHTALLTITIRELMDDPWDVEDKICTFLGMPKIMEEKNHIDKKQLSGSIKPIIELDTILLTEANHVAGTKEIGEIFSEIIKEEFKKTRSLTAWPCLSFWSAADESPKPTELSLVTSQLASKMSPNCKADFTKCTVEKDRCEERGDPFCN